MGLRTAQVCTTVHASPLTWVTRVLWVLLPVTLGAALDGALSGSGSGAGPHGTTGAVILAWAVWAVGLFASFVQLPVALTVLRIVVPLPLVAGVIATITEPPGALGWVGMAVAAVVAVTAMSAQVGDDFVNGSSYGDERRLALRPPMPLLLGPIQVVWICTALPVPVAIVLLSDGQRVGGGVMAVVGVGLAVVGFRALDRLTRRWLVLVPAGLTIVDPMALAEPILLRRSSIIRLGPAPADTDALDLSANAAGLILQADLSEPVELVPATTRRDGVAEPTTTTSVLVAPSRPGEMLAAAEERRIAVGRT